MAALKLTQIDDAVGIVPPNEVLERLKLEAGDTVFLTDMAQGVTLTLYDPELQEQLKVGREFVHEYGDTFRKLAK